MQAIEASTPHIDRVLCASRVPHAYFDGIAGLSKVCPQLSVPLNLKCEETSPHWPAFRHRSLQADRGRHRAGGGDPSVGLPTVREPSIDVRSGKAGGLKAVSGR